MKFRLRLVLIVFLIAACGDTTQKQIESEAGAPVSQNQSLSGEIDSDVYPLPLEKLQVSGNQIINEAGEQTILRGLSPVDPVDQALVEDYMGPWTEDTYRIMSEWGANIIRLPLHPLAWRVAQLDEALEVLDQTIEWAEKYKMYVIIDFHAIGFPPDNFYDDPVVETTIEEMKEFWQIISTRYADNTTVAFYEIFNEPMRSEEDKGLPSAEGWDIWKNFCEEIIDLIRQNDPDKIVIVGGLGAAYDLSFVIENPIERANIAYATHIYPPAVWYKDWDSAFGNTASQYPVIATEIGFNNQDESYELTESAYNGPGGLYRHAIVDYLESHQIGWVVWSFSHVWGPALLSDSSFTPTEAGEYFRERLLELNQTEDY